MALTNLKETLSEPADEFARRASAILISVDAQFNSSDWSLLACVSIYQLSHVHQNSVKQNCFRIQLRVPLQPNFQQAQLHLILTAAGNAYDLADY